MKAKATQQGLGGLKNLQGPYQKTKTGDTFFKKEALEGETDVFPARKLSKPEPKNKLRHINIA